MILRNLIIGYLTVRPKKINVVFPLSLLKKIGSVGRELFLFYQIFLYNLSCLCRKTNQTLTVCLKMTIKTLGSAQKIRVGIGKAETQHLFLGLMFEFLFITCIFIWG